MQPLLPSLLISVTTVVAFNAIFALQLVTSTKRDGPRVKTPLGGIKGYYQASYKGRKYATYEGVPYAIPPVGELRFQPPLPIKSYSQQIEATSVPPMCAQWNPLRADEINGQEDCLYLNVYVPITDKRKKSLPVMLWIHGGGFQTGAGIGYRAKYIMDRDMILVTINYRVGVFGFLSTSDEVVPGNMGLKDQSMALRWVSQNIKYFGGDAKRITIAGISAGGSSVHYHYLSPMSRGLFRNGISFSGTALNPWAFAKDTRRATKKLAESLNCPTSNSVDIVKCLKKVPTNDVVMQIRNFLKKFPFSFFPFPPTMENAKENYFINATPEEIIKSGNVYDAPWVAGDVKDGGLFMTANYILNNATVAELSDNWRHYAPYALHYVYHKSRNEFDELASVTRQRYFGNESFLANKRNLTRMFGDEMIASGAARTAEMHAKINKCPVWFYYYTYQAAQSMSSTWANSSVVFGVSHDDDVKLVLENDFLDPTTTARDRFMLEEMLDFWYSVANDGKPNLGVRWKPLNSAGKDFEYMNIAGPKNYKMEVNNNFGEMQFWNSVGL